VYNHSHVQLVAAVAIVTLLIFAMLVQLIVKAERAVDLVLE